MDKLKKGIDSLNKESLSAIAELIGLPSKSSAAAILNKFLTLEGIDSIFSSVDERDLAILYHLSATPAGLTLSELEKFTHSKSESIDASIERLKNLSLVYIMKNRKHLNNKLDKTHCFQPLLDLIRPALKNDILVQMKSILEYAETNPEKKLPHSATKEETALLETIFGMNGIASLAELQEILKKKSLDQLLNNLEKNGQVKIFHLFEYPFLTLILLSEKTFSFYFHNTESKKSPDIKNGFLLLNNLLKCHDIISTYGLFLTQQGDFRKVDRKRLSEACYHLIDHSGHPISGDEASQLSLYLMNMLKIVSLKKDAVYSELSVIADEIFSPEKILKKLISKQKDRFESDPIFSPPFKLPGKKELEPFVQIFTKQRSLATSKLKLYYFFYSFIHQNASFGRIADTRQYIYENCNDTLRFMLITGICEIEKDNVSVTEQGIRIAGLRHQESELKTSGSVYINPDFSMVIPKDTVTPESCYIVLAYSELIKNDVIINAKITKESVLRAFKRGMDTERFSQELSAITRNAVPQNLDFLLKEWISQTLKIEISLMNVIHSSRGEFLEELAVQFEGKVTIIGEQYALIKKEILDDAIKLAEKHKAVITLSYDSNG